MRFPRGGALTSRIPLNMAFGGKICNGKLSFRSFEKETLRGKSAVTGKFQGKTAVVFYCTVPGKVKFQGKSAVIFYLQKR